MFNLNVKFRKVQYNIITQVHSILSYDGNIFVNFPDNDKHKQKNILN